MKEKFAKKASRAGSVESVPPSKVYRRAPGRQDAETPLATSVRSSATPHGARYEYVSARLSFFVRPAPPSTNDPYLKNSLARVVSALEALPAWTAARPRRRVRTPVHGPARRPR